MSRFDITKILAPAGLQPPLTGPRDALPATVHKLAGDEDEAPPDSTPPKGTDMTNAQRILAALAKKSPADLTHLEKTTGISRSVLGVTLPQLVQQQSIERSPHQRGVYGLPGTDFPGTAEAPTKRPAKARSSKAKAESFADGVRARERELAQLDARRNENDPALKPRTNGTDLHPALPDRFNGRNAREVRDFNLFTSPLDVTSIPARAIATAAGGAIVLRGNTLTAELSAEEVNVIHQLRG